MRRLLSVVLVILYWVLCAALGVFVLPLALDYTIDHLEYHYHGGWEGMEVRHSRLVPCEEAEKWANATQRIWGDILGENPALEGRGFTFSVVKYGELGEGVGGNFTSMKVGLDVVSVAVKWDNAEPLEEVLSVKSIAHELHHLRRYLEKGDQEGCYLTGSSSSQWNLEDYLDNPCEHAAREFATQYVEDHPELLEEISEDSG